MVIFNDFLKLSQGNAFECKASENITTEREGWYYAFHVNEVGISHDNLAINSFCLPVFATKLSTLQIENEKKKAQLNTVIKAKVNKISSTKNKGGNKDKRGRPPKNKRKTSITNTNLHNEVVPVDIGNIKIDLPKNPVKAKEVYISRSGRSTLRTDYKELTKDVYIGEDDRKRRKGNGGGTEYSRMFSDQLGEYEYYDFIQIKNNLPQKNGLLSSYIHVDDSTGEVKFIDMDNKVIKKKIKGISNLHVGDILVNNCLKNDNNLNIPLSHLMNNKELLFKRVHVKHFNRLMGLCGKLIHPTFFYEEVRKLGGYESVVQKRNWQIVREKLDLPTCTSSGASLRKAYEVYFMS